MQHAVLFGQATSSNSHSYWMFCRFTDQKGLYQNYCFVIVLQNVQMIACTKRA